MNEQTSRMILAAALCAAGLSLSAVAAESPFKDAVKVWNFADGAGLKANGPIVTGVNLEGEENASSLKRGGDGRVAKSDGACFVTERGVRVGGKAMTLLIRARDSSGRWSGTLLARQVSGILMPIGCMAHRSTSRASERANANA